MLDIISLGDTLYMYYIVLVTFGRWHILVLLHLFIFTLTLPSDETELLKQVNSLVFDMNLCLYKSLYLILQLFISILIFML